ncbi:MAG: flagellar filament capping protein FliD, partial [Clostridia bacterium]
TLTSLAAAINAAGAPVDANVVTDGTGSYLELIGTQTDQPIVYGGSLASAAAADWEAVGVLTSTGSVAVVQAAQSAVVSMGSASVSSTTNTIATLIPGVTLSLQETGSTAITVSADASAGEAAVQSFVANWNQWVNDTFSIAWGPMPGTGASTNPYQVITSDMPMMTLNDLANQWSDLQVDGESFTALGITWSGGTTGVPTLQINSASLAAALAAAPVSVAAFFQTLSSTAQSWATGFGTGSDSTTGSSITGLQDIQRQLQDTVNQDNTEVQQMDTAARQAYLAWSSQLVQLASEENQTNAIMSSLLNSNGNTRSGG